MTLIMDLQGFHTFAVDWKQDQIAFSVSASSSNRVLNVLSVHALLLALLQLNTVFHTETWLHVELGPTCTMALETISAEQAPYTLLHECLSMNQACTVCMYCPSQANGALYAECMTDTSHCISARQVQ